MFGNKTLLLPKVAQMAHSVKLGSVILKLTSLWCLSLFSWLMYLNEHWKVWRELYPESKLSAELGGGNKINTCSGSVIETIYWNYPIAIS